MRNLAHDDLTALVGSRICHDLISPLGAIGNGLELLQMAGSAESPEMSLIAESVANANARIRFFRIAYGHAAPGQLIKGSEVQLSLRASFAGSRITVDWTPVDMARSEARLSFLILQCLEAAMPYGGTITVTGAPGSFVFDAQADRLAVDRKIWSLLSDPGPSQGLRPAQVQFGLLAELLATERRTLVIDLQGTQILIKS